MSLNIESSIIWATSLPILLQTSTGVGFFILGYIVYYRYLSPLANYPVPSSPRLPTCGRPTISGPCIYRIHWLVGNCKRRDFMMGLRLSIPTCLEPKTKRRRQMAHAFSLQSIKEMEHFVDSHIVKLRRNLDHFCDTKQDFDLKHMIAFYVFDVLGELAFSRSFNSQDERDLARLPPINDHVYLACLMGMTPDAVLWIKKVLPFIPIPWLRRLFKARAQLRDLAAACVQQRIEAGSSNRKDLLSSLLGAVDPETGSKLTRVDINTEAFGMIISPAFTVPLPRKIMASGGLVIQRQRIPQKTTVFAFNHVVHHKPLVWGKDHDQFIPDRFLGPNSKELQGYLSPFSTGHRMCIGKNLAMMNILKVLSKVGTVDFPFNISYCTSKAALIKLTSVLQAEADEVTPSSDINLYAIHPGAVRSGMKTAALATGIAKDALRGRHYDVEQDMEDVIAQASLLKADPLLHTLHISMLGSLEREEGAMAQEPEEKFGFPGF
ncbi:cytochrome P450 monooxygenase [Fusarium denticulatum]|uniref:Cytochrome P450 monooxygenase n=1 Tax=Fusarium denticulatum TaxID=48507 RepID=A0A8H5TKE7_9HYPO|nr:cytochrome P450 monooxygenase [Fusarium denticulatum]